MSDYHDPTWLVERAWSLYPLSKLQKLIESAIVELERLEPPRCDDAGQNVLNPVTEALKACVAELRHASGVPDAARTRAAHCELVRQYIAADPDAWGKSFGAALDEYRHAASTALQASLIAAQPS
jgi:hypothetical protein